MTHLGLTPLPPAIHHSSTPVTHHTANEILSSFLSLAALDPSLRPDSVLSERGPTSSSGGANPNLTLAHLERIAKGMRGERVGGGTDDQDDVGGLWRGARAGDKRKRESGDGDEQPETPRKGKRAADKNVARQDVEILNDAGEPAVVATSTRQAQDEDEWQDREDYDLAQDDDEFVVGSTRRNAGMDVESMEEMIGTEVPDEEVVDARAAGATKKGRDRKEEVKIHEQTAGIDQDVAHGSGRSKLDKAERKRLKKERSKKQKKTARPT